MRGRLPPAHVVRASGHETQPACRHGTPRAILLRVTRHVFDVTVVAIAAAALLCSVVAGCACAPAAKHAASAATERRIRALRGCMALLLRCGLQR